MPVLTTDDTHSPDTVDDITFSRRGLGKWLLLGASTLAVLMASGKQDEAQAAPVTDPWLLGGNSISTDGANFVGTTNVAPLIFKVTRIAGNAPTERMRITPGGTIGIGTITPSALLHAKLNSAAPALLGENISITQNAIGVQGTLTSTTPGRNSAGVRGVNSGTNNQGAGVRGSHAGGGDGVQGSSTAGRGVHAEGGSYGLAAFGTATDSTGVYGFGTRYGVSGYTDSLTGYAGWFRNTAGTNTASSGVGVQGLGSGGSDTLIHPDNSFIDAGGEFSGPNGVIGAAAHHDGYGVLGIQGPGYYAVYAKGEVFVDGNLAVGGTKNFEIDHPLDPANKTLRHAAVESSEVLNVYSGTVTLDGDGTATVLLPNWMEALNKDFHYQLTPIGAAVILYIAEELKDTRFKIAGGKPGMKVSWQVTGIRNDTYMQQHPFEVESDKQGADRGKYRTPEAFGQPIEKGVGQLGHKRTARSTHTVPQPPQAPPSQ